MRENKPIEERVEEDEEPIVCPSFADVISYASSEGYIDLRKIEKLEGRYGYKNGIGCDVLSGPCSCGGWH